MAGFDVAGARKAGYSDDEIAAHVAQDKSVKFDVAGALKAGYSATEVLSHLDGVKEKPSALLDMAKQAPAGLVEGAVGIPEMGAGMIHGVAKAISTLGDYLPEGVVREAKRAVGAAKALRDIAGEKPNSITELPARIPELLPQPETNAGSITRAATGAVPATMALGVPAAVKAGLMGGAASEATNQALEGSPFQGVASIAAGGVAGTAGPAALRAAAAAPRALSKLAQNPMAQYATSLALDATHGGGMYTMGKMAYDVAKMVKSSREEAPPTPLRSRYEGAPDIADEVRLKDNPPPTVSPSPSEGNPALVAAREEAAKMNALHDLAVQSKNKQTMTAANTRALETARDTPMAPGIARLTDPVGDMRARALEGASETPMAPGIARLTPEPPTPPIEPTPAAVAPAVTPAPVSATLPKDVAAQSKLLASGLAKLERIKTKSQSKPEPAPRAENTASKSAKVAENVEEAVSEAPAHADLKFTKVNERDRAVATEAARSFAEANPDTPKIVVDRYRASTEKRQARIRDRMQEMSGDPDFPSDNVALMDALDKTSSVRRREALVDHVSDLTQQFPEASKVLRKYMGLAWAKTVWNPTPKSKLKK